MAGGGKTELATGRAVEEPGFQHAAFDHFARAGGEDVYKRQAWKAKAQGTVDNAHMRYFIVHMHRLLDPDNNASH